MMKKWMTAALACVLLLSLLSGCAQKDTEKEVDLDAFYQQLNEQYDFSNLVDVDSEMQKSYYHGL